LVETSGKFLDVTGIRVDTSSPKGKSGTWLLDPFNVTITNGDANDVEETDNDGETIFTALGDTQIGVTIIENALRNSDVRISTGQGGQEGRGDITWLTGADLSALNGAAHTLTLQAAHNIDIGVPPAEPGPVIFAATSLPPLPSAKLKIAADGPGALNFNLSANSTLPSKKASRSSRTAAMCAWALERLSIGRRRGFRSQERLPIQSRSILDGRRTPAPEACSPCWQDRWKCSKPESAPPTAQ
jgi:hypothetical protein